MMARPKSVIPPYKLHTPTGQACCYVNRQRVYLGKFGSPESRQKYAEVLDKLAAGRELERVKSARPPVPPALTINDLFVRFATKEFPRYSGSEVWSFKSAMRVCRQMFGETPIADFGPLRFQMMRDAMAAGDPETGRAAWCRKTANRQAKRIRQIFRWGVSQELVPVEVVHRLDTVRALAIGETTAVDYAPRQAVPESDIAAVRAVLRPHYRDLLDLMLMTGARPGELLKLTGAMIERRADGVWLAELHQHKTARKGKRRFLAFNLSAQAILLRHLKGDPDALIFPRRRDNLTAAIARACKRAGVTPFCAHQLRHTTAARLVDEVGLEAAQAVLGHSEVAMTLHYSRSAERQAVEGVKRLG